MVPEPLDPASMIPEPFEVLSTRQDTRDTWTLSLKSCDGRPVPFEPGQFMMISAGGAGEVPISISGDPDEPELLVHTVRAVGLATEALCSAKPGRILAGRGPFGGSWPVAELEGMDVVLAAGGIGLAPLRPAIVALLARREHYGRLVLLYGGRAPDQLLYGEELEAWAARRMEVHITVDSAGPEWLGHVGVVTRLIARAKVDGPASAALTCGPEVMMRFTVSGLREAGVDPGRIYGSMERNMQCGIGHCGHCQFGPSLVCRDGPVYRWSEVEPWIGIREL